MIKGFLNLPWFAWAAIALAVALLYSFVWPHKQAVLPIGFRFFVLRWGHALTWLLLAVSFALRDLDPKFNGLANGIAVMSGLSYLLFILTAYVLK